VICINFISCLLEQPWFSLSRALSVGHCSDDVVDYHPRFIAEIHGIREEIICGIGYAGSLYPFLAAGTRAFVLELCIFVSGFSRLGRSFGLLADA
jgi:hypothetical protein